MYLSVEILTLDSQYLSVADGVPLDVGGRAGEGSTQLLLDPLENQGRVADEDAGIQVLADPCVLEISELIFVIYIINIIYIIILYIINILFRSSLALQYQRFYRN